MELVHSVPLRRQPGPCATLVAAARPALRPYVLGYAGFAAHGALPVPHRVLPLNLTTLVIDLRGGARLVTGPRVTAATDPGATWSSGVSVGLTPAGTRALLGVAMSELAGDGVPLADVLGRRDAELAERLHAARDWPSQRTVLDETLTSMLTGSGPPALVTAAWWALQRHGGPDRPGAVAARLGVSRRHLEKSLHRHVGLTPGAVARVARFQRAVGLLARRTGLAGTAAACGYADQSHFTRDVRRMAGVTPAQLFATVQYRRSPSR
ncbi:AraC family transcriptional regulator [Mangrovihabitans endophyticus]|uniref:HTH araC/xylS-type domain-containing protein n=1 Tax=Mangrovihabitans endophyticus TaxID=1751298 RepID=A0A8J3BYC0_9ACTN|nr:helix-turn-helix domain-containing protein [Mangrovihabitans endophyticus]GGK91705.1 hypothetical protein GCM10012284_27010 [Mangrovihabitans endophyticus]